MTTRERKLTESLITVVQETDLTGSVVDSVIELIEALQNDLDNIGYTPSVGVLNKLEEMDRIIEEELFPNINEDSDGEEEEEEEDL